MTATARDGPIPAQAGAEEWPQPNKGMLLARRNRYPLVFRKRLIFREGGEGERHHAYSHALCRGVWGGVGCGKKERYVASQFDIVCVRHIVDTWRTRKKRKNGKNGRTKAVAYLRISSAANVGADKDSEKRQCQAIAAYAKSGRFEIAADDWFYDPALCGADPIETRPGLQSPSRPIEGNGVRVVIIEDASRFARDLMTQELGILSAIKLGVRVITATGYDLTDTATQ